MKALTINRCGQAPESNDECPWFSPDWLQPTRRLRVSMTKLTAQHRTGQFFVPEKTTPADTGVVDE
jgi:hypothetical protein